MAVVVVEGAGVPLACVERGEGPAVLLVHDIAEDAGVLAPVAESLSARARAIAYDRRGYGASGAPEPYEATTVHEQAEDAAKVLRAFDAAPALVLGYGFGALVALDLLVRHGDLVRGAVVVAPPLFSFVPEATEALSAQRSELEGALRAGGPAHAVEMLVADDAAPEDVARLRAAHRAVFADLAGLASWPVTRAQLRAIAAPVAVLLSPTAPPHVAAAAEALVAAALAARLEHAADPATVVEWTLRGA